MPKSRDSITHEVFRTVLEEINKKLEDSDRLYFASQRGQREAVGVIPTGSFSLDVALGIGGWPKGCISELYGPESVGKSFLALMSIKEAQRLYQDKYTLYIDCEQSMEDETTVSRLEKLGIDLDRLILSHDNDAEKVLNVIQRLLETGTISLVVVDSIASMVTMLEEEGDFSDNQIGSLARLMGKAARKLLPLARKSGAVIIFINQIRENIKPYSGGGVITPGGHTLAHLVSTKVFLNFASSTTDILKPEAKISLNARNTKPFYYDKDTGKVVGARIHATVTKNKKGPAFGQAFYDAYWGTGICREGEILDLAVFYHVVDLKGGGYYYYNGQMLEHGRERAISVLMNNQELASKIANEVLERATTKKIVGVEEFNGTESSEDT